MEIPEHFTELSIRMSEVLDDSGAGKDTVMTRRQTYLRMDRLRTIAVRLNGHSTEFYHFGSQSEGTTTPGLQSDIDLLQSDGYANVIRLWGDWKAGIINLLMLNDDITPPQQYLLQVIRNDTPEPMTSLWLDECVRKDSGEVLFSAERLKQHYEHCIIKQRMARFGEAIKKGPSVSFVPNVDNVKALPVLKPLPEIQHWIDRCNSKHWPPAQLLDAARAAPCFLVPAGHQDSDYKREEWRLSPNLIERMLMFSFNMTQIKCCILLKIIKKSLFANIVGDSFTSFHCKTIMFYTIERTNASLWCEHNLMFLVRLCLHVLRKWLRLGRLPHFIIEGVNLFDGKFPKVQQRRLLVYIDSMIKNNLEDVFYIRVDNIGYRLHACSLRRIGEAGELGRLRLRNNISLFLKFVYMEVYIFLLNDLIYKLQGSNTTFEQGIKYALCNLFVMSSNVRW
ncbi:uncharacterized protein LOC127848736 [Dreissena polymorpha]|uniref:Mab-21-like HhH/H2TH-like domain-containing protein n=1 Tax=Dreissena polymorpha TaxID=45954 RepID=A0A9D4I8X8_DREPO|nr:uncharacterized protein LOC127848736 [Dreissena polymorpha]KAH3754196.1 hypothetical protein DPMN_188859 [Dreissena polymorpha]